MERGESAAMIAAPIAIIVSDERLEFFISVSFVL